jgi:excisionase family DNA binding protein
MIPKDRELLRPVEVARMFGVDPKTVTRWANTGRLSVIVTPGGHRRFRRDEVMAYLHLGRTRSSDV